MDIHKNARTTPHSRMLMVQRLASGWTVAAVAAAHGVSPRTVRKWRDRHAAEGETGLADRSSRPSRSPARLNDSSEGEILSLRRERLTGRMIARRLGRPVSTIGLVLRRNGLGRLRALDERPAVIRYERDRPGELLHVDIKKLGRIDGVGHRITGDRTGQSNKRGTGWEYLHIAIDDASEFLPSQARDEARRLRNLRANGGDPRKAKEEKETAAAVEGKILADCWTEFRRLRVRRRNDTTKLSRRTRMLHTSGSGCTPSPARGQSGKSSPSSSK
jgi:transposase-like protein